MGNTFFNGCYVGLEYLSELRSNSKNKRDFSERKKWKINS